MTLVEEGQGWACLGGGGWAGGGLGAAPSPHQQLFPAGQQLQEGVFGQRRGRAGGKEAKEAEAGGVNAAEGLQRDLGDRDWGTLRCALPVAGASWPRGAQGGGEWLPVPPGTWGLCKCCVRFQ